MVTPSHQGYVAQPLTDYEAQRRGGKGKICRPYQRRRFYRTSAGGKHSRHHSLFLQQREAVLAEKYQLPEASRGARGRPDYQHITVDQEQNERITAIPKPVREYRRRWCLFLYGDR